MVLRHLLFLFSSTLALNLPSDFPKCCLHDPEISQCIANAAEKVKPLIKYGIKEIGIESFYPIVMENFTLSFSGASGSFTNHAQNYTFYGINHYYLVDFKFDPIKILMNGKFMFNETFVTCFYSVTKGSLAEVPIIGNGIFGGIMGPFNISFEIRGGLENKNGVEYVKPGQVTLRFEISQFALTFEGLSLENGPWGNTNEVLISNNKLIGWGTTSGFNGIFEQYLTQYLRWFLNEIPYNNLFPCYE